MVWVATDISPLDSLRVICPLGPIAGCFGIATVKFSLDALSVARSVMEPATVGFLLGAIALVVIAIRVKVPWPLIVYGALVLAMDVGSNGLMNSKTRLLVPAFTLILQLEWNPMLNQKPTATPRPRFEPSSGAL